jgi:hypothetical protein
MCVTYSWVTGLGIQVRQIWRSKLPKAANIPTSSHDMFGFDKVASFEIKSMRTWDL